MDNRGNKIQFDLGELVDPILGIGIALYIVGRSINLYRVSALELPTIIGVIIIAVIVAVTVIRIKPFYRTNRWLFSQLGWEYPD